MDAEDQEIIKALHLPCYVCGVRLKKGDTRKCCAGCKKFYYCSKECQTKNWPEHKIICKDLKHSALPSLSDVRRAKVRRDAVLFGPLPLAERIRWQPVDLSVCHPSESPDPDTRRAAAFFAAIDIPHIHAFAASKWIATSQRGAVFFDLDAPRPSAHGVEFFPWIKWNALRLTHDSRIQRIIRDYDPATTAIVFVYRIDRPGSLKLWACEARSGELPLCISMGEVVLVGADAVRRKIEQVKRELSIYEWMYDVEEEGSLVTLLRVMARRVGVPLPVPP